MLNYTLERQKFLSYVKFFGLQYHNLGKLKKMGKKRVLTGIRPSGLPHLGNYFGAIRPAIELQKDYELFLFMADFHALNMPEMTGVMMGEESLLLAATLLGCGLDPNKHCFYSQSAVPETCELAWIISCIAPYGFMTRAHSFKDAQAKGVEINMGVFNYPLLMAADILLYDADVVPVGQDQKQHLEMTRDFAIRCNNRFGEIFKVPEPLISDAVATVPGIDGEKMSKSKNNVISIFNNDSGWKKQVMSIVTDAKTLEEPKNPETCNVFAIYKVIAAPHEVEEMASKYRKGGYGYGHAKQELLQKIKDTFTPMRDRYDDWLKRPADLKDLIHTGSKKVRSLATQKMNFVQEKLGFIGRPF